MESKKIKTSKDKKIILLVTVILIVAVICAVAIAGSLSSKHDTAMEIETTYLTVQYPKEYKEYLTYEETLDGQDSKVAFFMNYGEKKLELFRLLVLSAAPEVYEGFLNTENGIMYVSLIGSEVDRSVFSNGEEEDESGINTEMEALYFAMKDGMTLVMNSIEHAPGFSVVMGIFEDEKKDEALSYWTVSLPPNITWEEKTEGSVYRAVFYGNAGGKKVQLYTISLGDTTAEVPVGQFVVNGETKLVSVEVHDPNADGTLTNEEQATIYVLVDTVNDVLRAIREDENFRDQLEPVA